MWVFKPVILLQCLLLPTHGRGSLPEASSWIAFCFPCRLTLGIYERGCSKRVRLLCAPSGKAAGGELQGEWVTSFTMSSFPTAPLKVSLSLVSHHSICMPLFPHPRQIFFFCQITRQRCIYLLESRLLQGVAQTDDSMVFRRPHWSPSLALACRGLQAPRRGWEGGHRASDGVSGSGFAINYLCDPEGSHFTSLHLCLHACKVCIMKSPCLWQGAEWNNACESAAELRNVTHKWSNFIITVTANLRKGVTKANERKF